MTVAAGSTDTGWVMFTLTACLLVALVTYHVSRTAPAAMAPGPALLAAGAAGGLSVPIAFLILEKLQLLT
ncbi:hypothetical protein I6J42_33820 (plasmid) [Streptomyces californicus]|uniref:Uncharacterized protein n=1 Tax=Streptomyces californicus TaxID=67351 RepID=A0ABD7D8B5_9ACTN|nr:hypothetical protein [Streptomyces californicus]QRV39074.1 hypothetical protein I6J42_33820 [Streptomyces californicus]QRV52527.1 hypothetical protein I6J43_33840 [Streptomyces californicus]